MRKRIVWWDLRGTRLKGTYGTESDESNGDFCDHGGIDDDFEDVEGESGTVGENAEDDGGEARSE